MAAAMARRAMSIRRGRRAAFAAAALLSIACSQAAGTGGGAPDPSPGPASSVPPAIRGVWRSVDQGAVAWEIDSSGVKRGGSAIAATYPDAESFVVDSGTGRVAGKGIIRFEPSDPDASPGYLLRTSGSSERISILLADARPSGGRALSGLKGVSAVLRNVLDAMDVLTAVTGADGKAEFEGVALGAKYELEVPPQEGLAVGAVAPLSPAYGGQDMGVLAVGRAGQNFKVSYSLVDASYPLFAGTEYRIKVAIANVGDLDMLSASYALEIPEGMSLVDGRRYDVVGTIPAGGGEQSFELRLMVPAQTESERIYRIPIAIKDYRKTRTWEDAISLRFSKGLVTLRANQYGLSLLVTDGSGASYAMPGSGPTPITSISLPARAEPYLLCLSNSGVDDVSLTFGDYLPRFRGRYAEAQAESPESAYLIQDGSRIEARVVVGKPCFFYLSSDYFYPDGHSPDFGGVASWNEMIGAKGYDFQAAASIEGLGSAPTLSAPANQIAFTPPTDRFFYWRVRPRYGDDVPGDWSPPVKARTKYALGSTGPGGGVVFYDKGSFGEGWRYFERAATLSDPKYMLASGKPTPTEVLGRGIADGAKNTRILAEAGSYAAGEARAPRGGYEDWYMPTAEQYKAMGLGGFYPGIIRCWASNTRYDGQYYAFLTSQPNDAGYTSFSADIGTTTKLPVLAVRQF